MTPSFAGSFPRCPGGTQTGPVLFGECLCGRTARRRRSAAPPHGFLCRKAIRVHDTGPNAGRPLGHGPESRPIGRRPGRTAKLLSESEGSQSRLSAQSARLPPAYALCLLLPAARRKRRPEAVGPLSIL